VWEEWWCWSHADSGGSKHWSAHFKENTAGAASWNLRLLTPSSPPPPPSHIHNTPQLYFHTTHLTSHSYFHKVHCTHLYVHTHYLTHTLARHVTLICSHILYVHISQNTPHSRESQNTPQSYFHTTHLFHKLSGITLHSYFHTIHLTYSFTQHTSLVLSNNTSHSYFHIIHPYSYIHTTDLSHTHYATHSDVHTTQLTYIIVLYNISHL
jgi:hypothetical protein